MIEISKKNVYVIGDTHTLDYVSILEHYKLQDFVLIHVGDSGVGFGRGISDFTHYYNLNLYCQNNNGHILTIRGNHDNPAFFVKGFSGHDAFSNLTYVSDYTYYKINDKVFLFVGGAISIDRQARVERIDYWHNEKFTLPDNLETLDPCDILITHSCPSIAPPNNGFSNISGWFKNDPTLKEELIKERKDIQTLVDQVNPSVNLYGHFHNSTSERIEGTWYRCLDINEILDITSETSHKIPLFQ